MLPLLISLLIGGAADGELLVFAADWCPACRQMEPALGRLRREGFRVREVNVDREPEMTRRYGVTALPTFLVIADGKLRGRTVGATTEASLRRMLWPSEPRQDSTAENAEHAEERTSQRNSANSAPSAVSSLARLRAASVKVSVRQGREQWHGSGTCVWSDGDRAVLLTAAHVVRHAANRRVTVTFPDRLRLTARVQFADPRRDVAVLVAVAGRSLPCVPLGSTTLRPGAPVISIGYPGGGGQRVLIGRIVSVGRWSGFTEASMPATQGHSGGGLFQGGRLVGVLWGSNDTSLYASPSDLRAALDRTGFSYVGRVTGDAASLVPKRELGNEGMVEPAWE